MLLEVERQRMETQHGEHVTIDDEEKDVEYNPELDVHHLKLRLMTPGIIQHAKF